MGDRSLLLRLIIVGLALITLFVNGEQLLQVQDDDLRQGDVGLVAGTVGEPGTDILFDNFSLSEP